MKRQFSVTCTTCDKEPKAFHAELEPVAIFPWLLNIHSSPPHTNHVLSIRVDGEERVTEGGHAIEITCLRCAEDVTKKQNSFESHTAPLELVGALVLMMHSKHEAHPLKLVIDGKTIGV